MTSMRIVIDVYTCEKYRVDPVQYRKSLMNSELFRGAEIVICNDVSSCGDYLECGALMHMELFEESINQYVISALARELFKKQKSAT